MYNPLLLLVRKAVPPAGRSIFDNISHIYDDCVPASAIDAAFASATLLLSPCFPFYNHATVSKGPTNVVTSHGRHLRSTWQISVPSPLFSQLPIASHPSSFVERLVLRPRGTCCSCSKASLAPALLSAHHLNWGDRKDKNGFEHT